MKRNIRSLCCFLVVAMLLQVLPVQADQPCCPVYEDVLNRIYAHLDEARGMLCNGCGFWNLQSATRRLARSHPFASRFPRLASEIHHGIDKARTQVMWNDASDALRAVYRTMGKIERALANPGSNRGGDTSISTGALLAAPVAVGLGALLWGALRSWNWGMVSTGGGLGRNINTTLGHANPILVN